MDESKGNFRNEKQTFNEKFFGISGAFDLKGLTYYKNGAVSNINNSEIISPDES
jgi:hypothetical protein